jgi:hypothetical protein
MSRLFYLFLFLFGCCFSFMANGQSVSLTTSKSTVEVGEAFTATATISGLEDDEEVVAYEWTVTVLGTGGTLMVELKIHLNHLQVLDTIRTK